MMKLEMDSKLIWFTVMVVSTSFLFISVTNLHLKSKSKKEYYCFILDFISHGLPLRSASLSVHGQIAHFCFLWKANYYIQEQSIDRWRNKIPPKRNLFCCTVKRKMDMKQCRSMGQSKLLYYKVILVWKTLMLFLTIMTIYQFTF